MIWIIIAIGLLVLGIALLALYINWFSSPDWFEPVGLLLTVAGFVTTAITVSLAIINFACTDVNYEDAVAQKQMLEYRIEHCENLVGNELLYADIVNFNEQLRHIKRFANSPWTNWFYNRKIAEMDYIDIIESVKGEPEE